jgi:hypothetical protein
MWQFMQIWKSHPNFQSLSMLHHRDTGSSHLSAYFESFLSERAGPELPLMRRSVFSTGQYLLHRNQDLRIAALFLLWHEWQHPGEAGHLMLQIAIHDPILEVRALAIQVLGCLYQGKWASGFGNQVCRALFAILDSQEEVEAIRWSAHVGLLDLFREIEARLAVTTENKSLDSVDWNIICRLRAAGTDVGGAEE